MNIEARHELLNTILGEPIQRDHTSNELHKLFNDILDDKEDVISLNKDNLLVIVELAIMYVDKVKGKSLQVSDDQLLEVSG